jgi:hypothetical protein
METLELRGLPAVRGTVSELRRTGAVIRLQKNAIILKITSTFKYYRK